MRRGGLRDPGRTLFETSEPEAADDEARPQSVTGLTREIKKQLELGIGRVWVEGEISNLSRPRSGHIYFTLKDSHAAIGAVMWRSAASRLQADLADGIQVVVRGSLAVYEPQGRYQIVCDSIHPLGQGGLQQRFEELKARLHAEGLFARSHKLELPEHPRCVGIVTSATGAAIRDMLRILRRRLPGIRIILSPCPVQGPGAEAEIAGALQRLDACGLCDVILLGRGGGSLEDLWCFNEEVVARAVYDCGTPVISAVGHETDVTICDLVADLRAATPSEAAEMAVPDREEIRAALRGVGLRLRHSLEGRLREALLRYRALAERPVLRDPRTTVNLKAQRLDELSETLHRCGAETVLRGRNRLALCAARLEALSPLSVLSRGYSMTWDRTKMTLVRNCRDVTIGDRLATVVAEGTIVSTVTEIEPAPAPADGPVNE